MNIVVDAMGGDYAPENIVAGVVEAIKEEHLVVTLIGIEDRVRAELKKYTYPKERIEVLHAAEVVDMHDPAIASIRQKKNSSITLGVSLLREAPQKYDAFISAGNTGAVVAAATLKLGMIPGVDRPAIGLVIPSLKGCSFMMDVGANTMPKAEHLLHQALLSRIYMKEVFSVDNPTVGLLNIGEEDSKGTGFEKEAHKLMSEKVKNFIGNIEANEVYTGKCDCIICDGFVGNVVLKVSEGLMEASGKLIKREVKKDPLAMIGAFLMKGRLKHVKKLVDYSEYGGAPLLGVNGIVMISHGRSSAKAIKNAIKATMREVEHSLLSKMTKEFAN
ncbi:MAG: phosphate acyltransferase PlsX [Candidatus Omnitrophica bacterium]|nr:phosphate acyltransferase PlsX [Candidatus Omnitrophota bacterium]